MKRGLVVAIAVAMVMVVSGVGYAAISGSSHDLSTFTTSGETCVVCHAPHDPNPGDQPLWNHNLSSTTGYTTYGTTISQQTADDPPNAGSLFCMGCHDGATNIDAFGGGAGTTVMTGGNVKDKDLTDDHPVSITPSAGVTVPADWLISGKVECGSCHDAHITGTYPNDFMRVSNENSDLCTSCHTTK